MGYIYWKKDDDVVAFTSTRNDGYSKAPYDSFNQAFQVGDNYEDVRRNREKLCFDHHLALDHVITAYQQHTDIIMKVDRSMLGKGSTSFENGVGPCDALYTYEKGLALGVFHADCVPLFIYAPKQGLVGVIHAGKEGTFKKVTYKALKYIIEQENIDPKDIYLHLGPSITFSHFIINSTPEEMIKEYGKEYLKAMKVTNGVCFIDLPLINVMQARETNIPFENISVYDGCTFENEDLFFSHRRENKTGRHLSVIYRP